MRRYTRNFVTLKQERNDYSLEGRKALGRCIIESKADNGKLSVYVQDLKPQTVYKVYLISSGTSESLGISVGMLNVDSKGRGELKWEFNADNVNDTGVVMEEFNVVAIIVPKSNDIIAVMTGFMDNEVMWKNNFVDFVHKKETTDRLDKEKEEEQNISKELKEDIQTDIKNEKEKIIDSDNKIIAENEITKELNNENNKEEINEVEEVFNPCDETQDKEADEAKSNTVNEAIFYEAKKNEKNEKIEKDKTIETKAQEKSENKINNATSAENRFKKIIQEYEAIMKSLENTSFEQKPKEEKPQPKAEKKPSAIDYVFMNYVEMSPFQREEQKAKWVRITLKDLLLLDIDSCQYMNHPFITSNYRKYKHLILGEHFEKSKKSYILGIPDFYSMEYKEVAYNLGFETFKYCESSEYKNGDYGYWLKQI